jgi:cobalt-zinc-cadmium efflux system membrane fusion protein
MTSQERRQMTWLHLVGASLAMAVAGATGTYLWLRPGPTPDSPSVASDAPGSSRAEAAPVPAAVSSATPLPDVTVTLTPEAVDRAGIVAEPVRVSPGVAIVRAPGVVQANGYRQVTVTPLVGGRVTQVFVELGHVVRQGQPLAQIFSPELAEAQTRYLSTRAVLEAHELELSRTVKLVGIGAASRQELERLHAEHTAMRADLESAGSRLRLLGLTAEAVEALGPGILGAATAEVTAPMGGTVTERAVNVGLNVDPSTPLVTITNLSSVWVVVDVFERDFSRVRLGTRAVVTMQAFPERMLEGRVSRSPTQRRDPNG